MKHIRMMIAGAALLAGSLAFGANQDAVALTDTQMDQVTGEFVAVYVVWNGFDYTAYYVITNEGAHTGDHGQVRYIGGPIDGQVSNW